ncbi:hypothetical protein [Dysosmobacter sp.]|uniref:hypothetical protein n=1 Tax=Dysosmobacter sp. TaxID=2591382 RepID=UPI002852DB11|nr:hypothetical protein [Dysosmobacter sp.]
MAKLFWNTLDVAEKMKKSTPWHKFLRHGVFFILRKLVEEMSNICFKMAILAEKCHNLAFLAAVFPEKIACNPGQFRLYSEHVVGKSG